MGAAPPILVADSDAASRKLVSSLLRRIGYETREAKTGPEALELAAALRPDLILLEVNLPQVSGYEICRELRDDFGTEIVIIFLSADRTASADRVAGLLVGADDYIVKPFDHDELLARVRAALRRTAVPVEAQPPAIAAVLTPREREVLKLLGQGLSQTEIAATLVLSSKTVGGHIQRVLTKLGVHSRAQAVALAHQVGLMDVQAHSVGVLEQVS